MYKTSFNFALKPTVFDATISWKRQQDSNMKDKKGVSLGSNSLNSFIRMIQTAIPQRSLLSINSDVLALINTNREISWIGRKKDKQHNFT